VCGVALLFENEFRFKIKGFPHKRRLTKQSAYLKISPCVVLLFQMGHFKRAKGGKMRKVLLIGLIGGAFVLSSPSKNVHAQTTSGNDTLQVQTSEEYEFSPLEKRNAGRNYKIICYLLTILIAIGTTLIYRKAAKKAKIKAKPIFPVWLLYALIGYIFTVFISLIIYLISGSLGFLGLEPLKDCVSDPAIASQVGLSLKLGPFMMAHHIDLLLEFVLLFLLFSALIAVVMESHD